LVELSFPLSYKVLTWRNSAKHGKTWNILDEKIKLKEKVKKCHIQWCAQGSSQGSAQGSAQGSSQDSAQGSAQSSAQGSTQGIRVRDKPLE